MRKLKPLPSNLETTREEEAIRSVTPFMHTHRLVQSFPVSNRMPLPGGKSAEARVSPASSASSLSFASMKAMLKSTFASSCTSSNVSDVPCAQSSNACWICLRALAATAFETCSSANDHVKDSLALEKRQPVILTRHATFLSVDLCHLSKTYSDLTGLKPLSMSETPHRGLFIRSSILESGLPVMGNPNRRWKSFNIDCVLYRQRPSFFDFTCFLQGLYPYLSKYAETSKSVLS